MTIRAVLVSLEVKRYKSPSDDNSSALKGFYVVRPSAQCRRAA